MVSPGAGGLQQSLIPYAHALQAEGHDVQLIMHAKSVLLQDAHGLGLEPALMRGPHAFPLLQASRARRVMAQFSPNAVIGFASKGYPLARLAAPGGVPVFTRVGTMNGARMGRLLGADGLIVTSDKMRALALSLGAHPHKVEVVPNFLCTRKRLAVLPREVPRIGAMGRFMHRKGFDLLLHAAAILRAQGQRFDLVIGGAGPELGNLQQLASSLELCAAFPGWIANEAKPAFFQGLDIFVCPSRDEPFGQIFLEAMQAGVPVVAADTVGARCIFTHGHDGLIAKAEDAASLAREITRLLDNATLRQDLAEAGAATFARHYHTGTAGARLSAAITALIKNQR